MHRVLPLSISIIGFIVCMKLHTIILYCSFYITLRAQFRGTYLFSLNPFFLSKYPTNIYVNLNTSNVNFIFSLLQPVLVIIINVMINNKTYYFTYEYYRLQSIVLHLWMISRWADQVLIQSIAGPTHPSRLKWTLQNLLKEM